MPRPEALSFGSSTASSISPWAFRRVRQERDRLLEQGEDIGLDDRMEALRRDLKALLGIPQESAEVVLSPSGTDSVLHGLFLARALNSIGTQTAPLDCVLVASDETGSGVPQALAGRHFSTITAEGVPVVKGDPISGLADDVTLVSIPLSDAARMDQHVLEAVSRSVASGRRVLLQIMDCSKRGGRYPSADCLRQIRACHGEAVTVVVDACQMRLSLPRLHRHLAQGHLVLISGSKFFSGPPFSGALLVPAAVAARLVGYRDVPPGLRDYTNRASWPHAWGCLRAAMPNRQNLGQYLRWIAALEEMRHYFAVPQEFRRLALCRFATVTLDLLRCRFPEVHLVAEDVPPQEDWEGDTEMGVRTIFPFVVRRGDRWLSLREATTLYHALNQNLKDRSLTPLFGRERSLAATPCHLGQPVGVTLDDGQTAGALRLCAGAPMVVRQWSRCRWTSAVAAQDQLRQDVAMVLDKIAFVTRHLPSLGEDTL